MIKAHIVSSGGERGGVGCQGDCGDWLAVVDEAHGELGCEMLCIGGAASVAEEHYFVSEFYGIDAGIQYFCEWIL